MNKFAKLLKEVKNYGGYLFNTEDIIQEKTFVTNRNYKANSNECTYKIAQDKDDLISIRLDTNKVKFAVTSFIGNKLVKTFILLPKMYKKHLYREQIITYLLERNERFINNNKYSSYLAKYEEIKKEVEKIENTYVYDKLVVNPLPFDAFVKYCINGIQSPYVFLYGEDETNFDLLGHLEINNNISIIDQWYEILCRL